ncbi:MAG: DUF4760 domain-containing protein [Vulcanimicrobiaceae bacterium]
MPLESLSTAAAVATFFVIAATAVAALIQLRHLRISNQLNGLLTFLQLLQSAEMRELLNFVRHDLAGRLDDPTFLSELQERPVNRAKHPELYVCQFFDHIGSHVRSGLIEEDVFLQTVWYDVHLYWALLRPVIEATRKNTPQDNIRQYVFENFEYLAARAAAWMERHPTGNYPAGTSRMSRIAGSVFPSTS